MRMHSPKASAPSSVRHDGAHTGRAKRVMRRKMPDEHGPPLRVRKRDPVRCGGRTAIVVGRQAVTRQDVVFLPREGQGLLPQTVRVRVEVYGLATHDGRHEESP